MVNDDVSFGVEVTVSSELGALTFSNSDWVCTDSDDEVCDAITIDSTSALGPYAANEDGSLVTYYISSTGTLKTGGTYTLTFVSPTGVRVKVSVAVEGELRLFFGGTGASATNVECCLVGDTVTLEGRLWCENENIDVDSEIAGIEWEVDDASMAQVVSFDNAGRTDLLNSSSHAWTLTVKALKPGEVTFTGTTMGGISASYTLTIEPEMIVSAPEKIYNYNYLNSEEFSQQVTCTVTLEEPDADY
ncbi:MAG: hypothetical protein LUF27_15220 [Lachnospiraceae bacterium]|nr:hypothetical protein [Lachnospiraceae bacterium]